mgnify:CR=1 FL=1
MTIEDVLKFLSKKVYFTADEISSLIESELYFAEEELENIIDQELERDIEDINTDVIDICVYALNNNLYFETIEEAERNFYSRLENNKDY